jgi:hypothetical protein
MYETYVSFERFQLHALYNIYAQHPRIHSQFCASCRMQNIVRMRLSVSNSGMANFKDADSM